MTRKLWFQLGIGILLVLFIIQFTVEVKWLFSPIFVILQTIFIPLLISGVLFYITEPLQAFLEKYKFPRWASIITIISLILGVFWIAIAIVGPPITKQVNHLVENAPIFAEEANNLAIELMDESNNLPEWVTTTIEEKAMEMRDYVITSMDDITKKASKWIISIFQSVIQISLIAIMIPFFFIFMLKDHEKFMPFILQFFSGETKKWIDKTFNDVNDVLSLYIRGQVLISSILSILLFIGYSIIGLKFALLLVVFAFFMNIIPFIGPWIAFVPALIIGFFQDPMMVVWVSLVTLIAQQTDSNLITPNVMGKTLSIHPLTIITILLAAGSLAGFFGILLAVPVYAVGKAIVSNIYDKRKEIKATAQKTV